MKHLPDPVRDALAAGWNLDPLSLSFLGGGQDWSDGTLFTAPTTQGDLVLKILDFPAADHEALQRAGERIRLVRFLGQHGCPIVTPTPSRQGDLHLTRIEGGRLYLAYAYPKVEGRSFLPQDPAVVSGALFETFGETLGQLHAASLARSRPSLPDGSDSECRLLKGWREEMAFFRLWCQEPEVARAWDNLHAALHALPVAPGEYGFVHNDLHLANLLYRPEEPGPLSVTVIDFDVANNHWFMADCAIALYSLACLGAGGLETASGPPEGWTDRAWPAFWKGYRRHRVPSEAEFSRLDLFLHYRRCLLFMPLQSATADDPAWRQRWMARIAEGDRRLFG